MLPPNSFILDSPMGVTFLPNTELLLIHNHFDLKDRENDQAEQP